MRSAVSRAALVAALAVGGGVGGGDPAGAQTAGSSCRDSPHVAPGDERYICALYVDLLQRDRVPSDAELAGWTAQLATSSRATVTRALAYSDENLRGLVRGAYRDLLFRSADPGGLAHWVDQLRRGTPLERVEAAIVSGAEGFRVQAGSDAGTFVDALYALYLDRVPTDAEVDGWTAHLAAQGGGAAAREQMTLAIASSPEGRRVTTETLFDYWLPRLADPGGRTYWSEQLRIRGFLAVEADFVAEDEVYRALER
ncbi:MAG: DUF4214 domain-containing protein [Actinomycetota bacterium]|nr:DUF4214 domain-containing protein [Acidimicrobiia bacterium]MDQ3294658.1 DUF4214 domain-containing protein [Actinomycetota bacterium]